MTNIYPVILGILCCLICSAFFSLTEMAYSSCSIMRLEKLAEEGNRRAKAAYYITRHFDNALSTILIGNNLANIAGSSLASVLLILLFGQEGGEKYAWVSTVVMTVLVIVFGETLPKISAKKNANRWALQWVWPIRVLMVILFPVVWIVVTFIHLVTLPLKGSNRGENPEEAVEELQSIIETAEDENVLDEDRSELIRSAIDFSEISASEVMTARVDVYALDNDDDRDEIVRMIEEAPYSRIPVYRDSIDNIIGILYVNRFLKAIAESKSADIAELLMEPVYVYKTMKLPDVLSTLRKAKLHLAVVTDEYGGVLGVLSMEDVLEQIVGDIWDDSDVIEQEVVERSETELELDGDVPISDFCELIGIREDDFDYESETVGGWTVEILNRYPETGDSFSYRDMEITILETGEHRVERILIKKQ